MSKKRKYSENYVAFRFTLVTDSDGSERPQCFLCGKVLANARVSNQQNWRSTSHPFILKMSWIVLNLYVVRRLDLRKVELCQSSGSSRHRSLPSKHRMRLLLTLWHYWSSSHYCDSLLFASTCIGIKNSIINFTRDIVYFCEGCQIHQSSSFELLYIQKALSRNGCAGWSSFVSYRSSLAFERSSFEAFDGTEKGSFIF